MIKGIVGAERDLSAMINDPTSDVNALNEAGIVTVFNSYGTGLRTWGNRSSAWPASTVQSNFLQTRRTMDMIMRAWNTPCSSSWTIPSPIRGSMRCLETANGFLRVLIGRGALVQGSKVSFLRERNPAVELAAGHITFSITACPPPPAERITWESFTDITLLGALGATAGQ